jgi:hypothetical protein
VGSTRREGATAEVVVVAEKEEEEEEGVNCASGARYSGVPMPGWRGVCASPVSQFDDSR